MEGDGVGSGPDGLFDGAGRPLVVFIGPDRSRAVDVDDVAFSVFVLVDARGESLLG